MRRQRVPPTANCCVFFRGVPLYVTHQELRPHFESVGRVLEFRMMGPAPGKDFRYGEVDYVDEKTAQEAILRLHGHAFGDRTMRVSLMDSRLRKRGRREGPGYHSYGSSGRGGRGGGWSSSSVGLAAQTVPTTDDRGRPFMQFSRGFFDPVLGREDSMVLDVLKRTATEEAYEAVEQLRVLVMERPEDAQRLLQENPALISAVIMVLQHARRIPFGALPPEAFDTSTGGSEIMDTSIIDSLALSTGKGKTETDTHSTACSGPSRSETLDGSHERSTTLHVGGREESTANTSTEIAKKCDNRQVEDGCGSEMGTGTSRRVADSSTTSSVETAAGNTLESGIKITDTQRQQALQSIKKMRDEDVEKILVLTPNDFEKVQNVQQRRQLQVLQQCLLEMSRNL